MLCSDVRIFIQNEWLSCDQYIYTYIYISDMDGNIYSRCLVFSMPSMCSSCIVYYGVYVEKSTVSDSKQGNDGEGIGRWIYGMHKCLRKVLFMRSQSHKNCQTNQRVFKMHFFRHFAVRIIPSSGQIVFSQIFVCMITFYNCSIVTLDPIWSYKYGD